MKKPPPAPTDEGQPPITPPKGNLMSHITSLAQGLGKREPQLTAADVRRIAREAARAEVETRINMLEPAAPAHTPSVLGLAVDAFEVASLGAAMVGAFAIKFVQAAIK